MLARLSRTCSQLADLRWNTALTGSTAKANSENESHTDENVLLPAEAVVWPHSPGNALESVTGIADVCGKMFNPLYKYVESTLSADVERLVLALNEADSEFLSESDADDDEDIYVIPFPPVEDEPMTLPCLPPEEPSEACTETLGKSPATTSRGTVCALDEPSVPQRIPIPRILITPAPPQPSREMSCCVPVQDTSFGQRLTVPSHTALNACHPPMLPTPHPPQGPLYSAIRGWKYRQGHWCAVVLALQEQEHSGIFSRPINLRRRARAMRKRAAASRQNLFASRSKRDS